MLTTARNRASRSACSSRDRRIISSVAATDPEAGERFNPSVTARSGRSVGAAEDVVGDLHLVADGIRIGSEPEGADVDEPGAAAREGDDTIAPCHEKVVVVVDLPAQEIDVEIVGAVLRARTEEAELDQVVLGP